MTTQQADPEWFRTPTPLRRNRMHWFAGHTHEVLWSKGGRTAVKNGELICPRHHTLVHQGHSCPRRT